jgi:hypothetical protein
MKAFFFLFPLFVFGAYVGNPANPAIMNTGFFSLKNPFMKGTSGYIYDYTSNKRYEADQKNPDFDPNQTFKEFGLHSQLATFSVILLERMEIFGSAGGTKEQAKGRTHPTQIEDFKSDYQFSWSAGTKIVLLQWGKTYLSCDFTYFAVPESANSFFKYLNRFDLPLDFTKHNLSLREWQFSGALSSRFWFLTPYIGGTYLNSRLHVTSSAETGPINYHNEKKLGWFFGLTVSLTGRFHFNLERRLRDEFGYTFSTIAVF